MHPVNGIQHFFQYRIISLKIDGGIDHNENCPLMPPKPKTYIHILFANHNEIKKNNQQQKDILKHSVHKHKFKNMHFNNILVKIAHKNEMIEIWK